MNNRILFMLINGEMKYLQKNDGDHREWYLSLGGDPNNFENIVRGFILDGKIVFYKGINFNYDDEVIRTAQEYAPSMRLVLGDPTLEVWCGVVIEGYNAKWEPILRINDEELTGFSKEKKEEVKKEKEQIETGPLVEFKNDYNDDKVIQLAVKVTGIVLALAVLSKIALITRGALYLNTFGGFILFFGQIGLLVYAIYGYKKKLSYTKYISIAACFLLVMTLSLFDIILAIIYFLFSVDQSIVLKAYENIKEQIEKMKK
ncbi:MAG: hypothetical protein IJI22_04885 [Bacilli bacterium]|nr:hypothetical protein [Bacilli bacterium]